MGKSPYLEFIQDNNTTEIPKRIKLISWNVMARDYSKIEVDHDMRVQKQLDFLDNDFDFILLQEVDQFFFQKLKSHPIYNKYNTYLTDLEPYGQIILSKYEMNVKIYRFGKNGHKKILILFNEQLQIINCHLRATRSAIKERTSQVTKILRYMVDTSKVVLLGGDLNMVDEDEKIPDWIDLATCLDPTFDPENNPFSVDVESCYRFDRIYTNCQPESHTYQVNQIKLSDHYPIVFDLITK